MGPQASKRVEYRETGNLPSFPFSSDQFPKQEERVGHLLHSGGKMVLFFTPEAKTGETCGGEVRGVRTYLLRLAFHFD